MDVMLQRHCARHIYIVPEGLKELMSDISREVLRNQPDDMYTFIADYLDALLITRENARIAAKFVQTLTETVEIIVELLNSSGMNLEEANKAAEVIQEAFKSWSNKRGILKESEDELIAGIISDAGLTEYQADKAAVWIQHAFRAYQYRQEREKELLHGMIDWRVAARSAIQLYRKTGVSNEEAKRAANLIKAAYKGYYTRRALAKLKEPLPEEEDEYSSSDEEKKKAVRIDFQMIPPHVEFREGLEALKEDTLWGEGEIVNEIVRKELYVTSNQDYIRALLEKYVFSTVCNASVEAEEAPTDAEQIPTEEATVEEVPTEEAALEAEEVPSDAEQVPTAEAPLEAKEIPIDTEQIPTEEAAVKEVAVEEVPTKEATVEQVPRQEAPQETEVPVEQLANAPADETNPEAKAEPLGEETEERTEPPTKPTINEKGLEEESAESPTTEKE